MVFSDLQKTLKREISISGIGLFSGQKSCLNLLPAEKDTGILFKVSNQGSNHVIKATVENVKNTLRSTALGSDQAMILTVEHLLAALYAFGISNLIIELEGIEVPILDGSAKEFAELIEEAGIDDQKALREVLKIEEPVYFTKNEVQLIALPHDKPKISYLFHYPTFDPASQFVSLTLEKAAFVKEIAPARTFSFYEEIKPFLDQGLIKGGGLDSAILVKENKVLNPEGLRFVDEFARHKMLDLIGDLSLSGRVILGHVIALRSGHASNVAFVKKMLQNERKKNECFAVND